MTRPRYTFSVSRARAVPAAAGAGAVAAIGLVSWAYTVDDAFIAARYARHVAHGLGYAMNPGHPSDGVTGPLWIVPQIAAIALGLDPIAIAKALGLACTVLAVWLAVAGQRARALGRSAAAIAAVTCALSPSLSSWAVAGLETGLATLLLTLSAAYALRSPRASGVGLGVCVAAIAWVRPELAFACAGLLFGVALRDTRAARTAVALALIGASSVTAWRLSMFGDALPISYHAKAGSLQHGLHYTATALVLATSLAGIALCALGAARGDHRARTLALALGLHVLAMVLAGGDWMPGYRLLVPALPLYAQLLAIGATRGLLRRRRLSLLLVALACALPAIDLATRIPELRASADGRPEVDRLAQWLARNARSVALVDVGYLGYTSGIEIVDLGGLTDPSIARMPGGHLDKRIDPAYLAERSPDAYVFHSRTAPRVSSQGRLLTFDGWPVERRVAALASVHAEQRVVLQARYAAHYHYVLLARGGR